jgi:hypothetical protein
MNSCNNNGGGSNNIDSKLKFTCSYCNDEFPIVNNDPETTFRTHARTRRHVDAVNNVRTGGNETVPKPAKIIVSPPSNGEQVRESSNGTDCLDRCNSQHVNHDFGAASSSEHGGLKEQDIRAPILANSSNLWSSRRVRIVDTKNSRDSCKVSSSSYNALEKHNNEMPTNICSRSSPRYTRVATHPPELYEKSEKRNSGPPASFPSHPRPEHVSVKTRPHDCCKVFLGERNEIPIGPPNQWCLMSHVSRMYPRTNLDEVASTFHNTVKEHIRPTRQRREENLINVERNIVASTASIGVDNQRMNSQNSEISLSSARLEKREHRFPVKSKPDNTSIVVKAVK